MGEQSIPPPPTTIEEKLDAILRSQGTLASEVHAVNERIRKIEHWRDEQEGVTRRTQRSLTENDVRDQVFTNMVANVEEELRAVQRGLKAMTAAQAVVADTNRQQTEAVQSLTISASMKPVVSRFKRRMPAYLAIATGVGALLATLVQAYLRAVGKG